jgi:lambda family phage portal protein
MNITDSLEGRVTLTAAAPATAAPSAMITPLSMTPDGYGQPWGGGLAGGGLFKNMETFPGQVLYTPPKMSARQEGKIARRDSVRAARNAERTSEHIRGGIDRKTDMVVGATLRVHAQPDWDLLGLNDGEDGWKTKKPFAQACQREFYNWAYDSRLLQDAEGHYNFGGLMWLAFRNLIGPDAECAGIIHYDEARAERYKARWATFVTILDPDRIETPPEKAGEENVFEGKKLDEHGRMTGFWVAKKHPSEGAGSISDVGHTFVPRETEWGRAMGFHWFVKTRGGQQRGVTSLVTILRKTGMLDGFDDAYLGAAVVNQVLSNYIETMASPETMAEQLAPAINGKSPFDYKLDYYEKAKIRIGGVRIPTMPPGDKIMMTAVNRAIGDPSAFRNGFLREFASSLGMSFEQLSMNFSDANYSAARAALLEVWRGVLTQRKMFTAHVASLIYAAVIEEAIYKGRIQLPPGAPPFQENRAAYTACAWTGPGMGWIDPQKEANAIKTMLEIKMKSRAQAVAEMDGGDYLETFDQIEQEILEAEERNFTLDPLAPGTPGAEDPQGDTPEEQSANAAKKKKAAGAKDGDGDGQVQEGAA